MKRRHFILLGLLAFVYALIVHAPAAALYGWLAPQRLPADLALHGIDGTLSSGRVAALNLGNRTLAKGVAWELRPLDLLRLRAGFDMSSEPADTLLQGQVALTLGQALLLRDFRAAMPVDSVLQAAGFPFIRMGGQARLVLEDFELDDGFPRQARGSLDLQGLSWALAREPIPLGDYRAELSTEGPAIIAKVRSLAGPLDLSGTLRLVDGRDYEVDVQFRAKADAPPMVQEFVRSRGNPDTRGYHHWRQKGSLASG